MKYTSDFSVLLLLRDKVVNGIILVSSLQTVLLFPKIHWEK